MQKFREGFRPKQEKEKQTFLKVTGQARLMEFLIDRMPDKSRKTVKSLLAHHQVSVDDKSITQFDHPLKAGQQVVITWTKVLQRDKHKDIKVVFEDPYIVVIEKQPGMLSIATDKEKERTAFRILSDQVKKIDPKNRIFVVHRLDREASGLMMFAKSREIQRLLQDAWQEDVLERTYAVVVEGRVPRDQGVITSWLKENAARVMYSSSTPGDGQKAVTRYTVQKRSKDYSLLEVSLETGRKNQIRIHMKDLGHSIIGDKKYGAAGKPIPRLGLHARVLAFRHPVTGKEMRFETPIPKDFLRLFSDKQG
jgi:23S rRNA pseudouridine1911/1915/1917 synthase